MYLEKIKSPDDLKKMDYSELRVLSEEIRGELVSTVAKRGGHLASNLGVVELTIALHRVFDMPRDKIIFDVGHQCYVHKLLTGRFNRFQTLRTFGGLSGFPKRNESEYDVFETGHASTAISAAVGIARARDLHHEDFSVIALVGDGALTGGMCYEALNDAGNSGMKMIVILNDNEMSISPNVGALSQHLTDIRISSGWNSTKKHVKQGLTKIPVIGKPIYHVMHWAKSSLKSALLGESDGFFNALGFHYFGPIDGHNLKKLEHTLELAKKFDGPCVIHVLTKKGCGYDKAEEKPEQFHGTPPFYVDTGEIRSHSAIPSFGAVMASSLIKLADENDNVVAVTAAMANGTGIDKFQEKYPARTFDVGIAEEHAVTMAAGMAAGNLRPYVAIYATFFQRSYDQVIHDVCMQNLPVVFLLDRAGIAGEDGATHNGVFDIPSLLPLPNMTILAPRDLHELELMMRWSINCESPCAIRYGKRGIDMSLEYPCTSFSPGKWEMLEDGTDMALLAVGSMVDEALLLHELLKSRGYNAAVVNCSSVKPLDEDMLREKLADIPLVTMEESMLKGGFGSYLTQWCVENELTVPVLSFGIPELYVRHGQREKLLRFLGLTPQQMCRRIVAEFSRKAGKNG